MSERAAADPKSKMCEIRVENVQPKDIGKWKWGFRNKTEIWLFWNTKVYREVQMQNLEGKDIECGGKPR